jgi:hypothetical protein
MDLGSILSGPIGAIFGAGSAIVTKVIDYKDRNAQRDHELQMRDKDREQLAMELASKSEIAKVDADTQVTMKEFDAVAASIGSDKATYGDSLTGRIVDAARGLIRPVITSASMALVIYDTVIAFKGAVLSPADRMTIINTAQFLAGTAIAWWFGARANYAKR